MLQQSKPATAEKAQTVVPATSLDYSNEPLVVEHNATLFHYNADGTGERTLRSVIHLQSDAAVRQFGVLNFAYAGDNESVELRYVRVRKSNGTVIPTEASAAQDMPAEVTRQAPLYSDQRQLQVPVRSLAVGDRIEYEAVIHMRKAEAPGEFWNAMYFESKGVSLDEQTELRFPASRKVTVLSPGSKPEQHTEKDEAIYRWHSEQRKPTVAPPGGSAPKEEDAPARKLVPDVAWTTFQSWAAVGEWYRTLAGNRAVPDDTLRAKAASLTVGASSEDEKIARIYSFVSMQIRYIGIDFGVGRFQPHMASEVLGNGYGDCKDKHTLLAAMLTAAGFRVDPVLIGANIHMDKDLPAPNSFNHVITVVERDGGKRLWLDSTAEVAPPGMLSPSLRDEDALLVPPLGAGAPTLVKTPATPPFQAFDRYESHGTLTSDGKLNAHFDATLRGDLELLFRSVLFAGGRGQWPELGQGISSNLGFSGKVSVFVPTDVDTPDQPLHLTYDYEREAYGDWANHRILSLIPFALFAQNELTKQPDEPIALGAPRLESAKSTITLPVGYSIPNLPSSIHAKASFGAFDLTYTLHPSDKGLELVTEARLEIKSSKLPQSAWLEYNTFAKDLQTNSEVFIQLAQGPAASPAPVGGKSTAVLASSANGDKAAVPSSIPEQAASASVTMNAGAQSLLQEAGKAIQAKDWQSAQAKLDAARAIDPTQIGTWWMAAMLAGQRGEFKEAEADMAKETMLYPVEHDAVLPVLLWLQLRQEHRADAIVTLEALRKLKPSDAALPRQEAALLTAEKRHEEAVSLLEGVALRSPSDKATLLALGHAQLAAGRTREASVTLETTLDGTDDPEVLNDAAYELADHEFDLTLASKSAHKALGLLEIQTKTLSIDNISEPDLDCQRLLTATWDTLGWIDYLQGNTGDAESLLRSAWISTQRPEVGYHLGMLHEKEGKPQQALEAYELAIAAEMGKKNFTHADDLEARRDVLASKRIHTVKPQQTPSGMLGQQRSLQLPFSGKKQATADFFIITTATTKDAHFIQGDPALESRKTSILDAISHDHSIFTAPTGSSGKVLRRGTLFCSLETKGCEFTVFLTQDTHVSKDDSSHTEHIAQQSQ